MWLFIVASIMLIVEALYFTVAMESLTRVNHGYVFVEVRTQKRTIRGWLIHRDFLAISVNRRNTYDMVEIEQKDEKVLVTVSEIVYMKEVRKLPVIVLRSLL